MKRRHEVAVRLRPAGVAVVLAAVGLLLVLASLAGTLIQALTEHDHVFGLIPLFRVDAEATLPSYFSALQLALAAGLLGLVAAAEQRRRPPNRQKWLLLACGFALMSVDEAASLHEKVGQLTRRALDAGWGLEPDALGPLYFSWVIPGIPLAALIAAYFLRFLRSLPTPTARLFVLSGCIFLAGAIGLEMVGGHYVSLHQDEWRDRSSPAFLAYNLIATGEEALEMFGITVFIYALLRHLGAHGGQVRITFDAGRPDDDARAPEKEAGPLGPGKSNREASRLGDVKGRVID